MRQRNHCSSLKGIPKMKLQDSGPSGPKSLQSQNRPRPENRLSISRLDVVHAQLARLELSTLRTFEVTLQGLSFLATRKPTSTNPLSSSCFQRWAERRSCAPWR